MATVDDNKMVERILAAYSLKPTKLLNPERGYRNRSYPARLADGRTANLIVYKSDPDILRRIRHANYVANYLASRSLPTRRTLDSRIIALRSPMRVKYAAIYHYLPGNTIPWEAYTMKHLKLLGWSLGRMHAELAPVTRPKTLPSAAAEYLAITRRMRAYFGQPTVQHALQAKLRLGLAPGHFATSEHLLREADALPNQQILHLDFVRSNILFGEHAGPFQLGNVAITGILDFEKTAWGHPVFDLARTLAFLLVDCQYKPAAKIRRYFLRSGYAKRGHGTLPKTELLEPLVTLFLTYDLYKFLRHNPYESLPQNKHFVRTRALLIRRRVIAPSTAPLRFASSTAKTL